MQLIKLIILSIVIILNPMLHADPKGLARLDQMDANQNGEITLDEFNLSQLNRFNLIDLNSDGRISKEELLFAFSKINIDVNTILSKLD